MKEIIRRLFNIETLIEATENEIIVTEKSTFYSVFSTEAHRNDDVEKLLVELRGMLSVKHGVLEDMRAQSNRDLIQLSRHQRDITLSKV